jgi:hypothetical protein
MRFQRAAALIARPLNASVRSRDMRVLKFLPLFLALVACSPLRGCTESVLSLSDDSRLPKWLPPELSGQPKNTIRVQFEFYSPLFSVNNTVIEVFRNTGAMVWETTGQNCWHPVTVAKRNKFGGLDDDAYPTYTYLNVGGQIEVLEQRRMGAPLGIVDDPSLTKAALETKKCE